MSEKSAVTVFVCTMCDRDPAKVEAPRAEGLAYLAHVKKLLRGQPVKVCGVKCLGGCEANGTPNGCCSVGLAGEGRHSYVFNKLNPSTDDWKLLEFLKLYLRKPHGRIMCGESARADELRPHVATRVPPPKL
jgi:predicted metal-binding protein